MAPIQCELEQKEFDEAIAEVDAFATAKADKFAKRAQEDTRDVAVDLEDDDDLAVIVGASAGAAAGTYIAGPVGGAVGGMIGREVGKLFIIDIEMRDVNFSLDVPQFSVERRDIKFDVPQVTMKNRDIIFHTPSVRMKRVKGPPIWKVKCTEPTWSKPIPKCTGWWDDTWIEIPEPFMQEQHIVLGIPEVRMDTTSLALDVPTSEMKRQDFSLKVPSVTVRSKVSEAKKVESKAKELTKKYEKEGERLTQEVKELSKERLAPRMVAVFSCHRGHITAQLEATPRPFDLALASINESLAQLTSKGVPSDDDDYAAISTQRDKLINDRAVAVDKMEEALELLNNAEKQAMASLFGS